jgi:hypothetical protein
MLTPSYLPPPPLPPPPPSTAEERLCRQEDDDGGPVDTSPPSNLNQVTGTVTLAHT